MVISGWAKADFEKHAVSEYPKEAAGLIINGHYVPCTNIAPVPTENFQIAGAEMALLQATRGRAAAILHSHPYDKRMPPKYPAEWPSGHDMQQWMKGDIPWGIACTDGEGISQLVWLDESKPEPIDGREFIHGINDCYSLIRDWFKLEKNIILPNFARGMEWWNQKQDLYSENFEKAGFVEIDKKDATIGDCVLMKIVGPVIHHAAVITGPDEIRHHIIHRLSGTDSLRKWDRCADKYVRYKG